MPVGQDNNLGAFIMFLIFQTMSASYISFPPKEMGLRPFKVSWRETENTGRELVNCYP